MRARLGEAARNWRIESAGTWAVYGEQAAPRAIKVLKARGIDLSAHRSRVVDPNMLSQMRLILVMEKGHKEALQVEFPRYASKVFLLSEMVGEADKVRQFDLDEGVSLRSNITEIKQLGDALGAMKAAIQ